MTSGEEKMDTTPAPPCRGEKVTDGEKLHRMIWNDDETTRMEWAEERQEEAMEIPIEEHADCQTHTTLPIPRDQSPPLPIDVKFFQSLRDCDEYAYVAMCHAMSCDRITSLLELCYNLLCSVNDTGVFRLDREEIAQLAVHKDIYRKWRRPVKFPQRRKKDIMQNRDAVQTLLRIALTKFHLNNV